MVPEAHFSSLLKMEQQYQDLQKKHDALQHQHEAAKQAAAAAATAISVSPAAAKQDASDQATMVEPDNAKRRADLPSENGAPQATAAGAGKDPGTAEPVAAATSGEGKRRGRG